ncbi:MAG: class II glutamine amidotransferase [Thermoanaerobaculaceae bacterium]|jgi:glutamine amidotransferase
MCRLLAVKDRKPFGIGPLLRAFAAMARASREYQGDGWGCAWRDGAGWQVYHSLTPIWDDDHRRFGETGLLVAHARSAFRNEGIAVENNMPFLASATVFAFNGELHGVRIREEGRIGAEKVFNTIRRLADGDLPAGLARATALIHARSRYVRAMNIVLSDGERILAHSSFGERPDYFTVHVAAHDGRVAVCSEPLPGEEVWQPMANGALEVFS